MGRRIYDVVSAGLLRAISRQSSLVQLTVTSQSIPTTSTSNSSGSSLFGADLVLEDSSDSLQKVDLSLDVGNLLGNQAGHLRSDRSAELLDSFGQSLHSASPVFISRSCFNFSIKDGAEGWKVDDISWIDVDGIRDNFGGPKVWQELLREMSVGSFGLRTFAQKGNVSV